jgi:hypothetical protein
MPALDQFLEGSPFAKLAPDDEELVLFLSCNVR